MAQWSNTFTGTGGGSYRLYVNVDVIGQETNNNRTLIRYNCWVDKTAGSGYWNFSTVGGNTNINGYNPGRSWGGGYDFRAYSRKYIAQNEDYWIGHDGNGDANPYFGANWNMGGGSVPADSSTGGHFWMPHINRYTNWTQVSFSNTTDVGWTATLSVDAWSNNLAVDVDGAGWYYLGGDWLNNRSIQIGGNMTSGVQHSVRFSARRSDSGLWTETGTYYNTTLPQNAFMLLDAGSGF